ncbi:hypothetical protein [Jeotgalibacillus aurantiacus]|uniref:hypothetical protein n=1 Tax=Jeotgalibacillus aurantiacus TaxID=2763266 RepID=UPI001D0B0DF6|nr:hypothetical protein [Jeotgalibacillus aurantiacus]
MSLSGLIATTLSASGLPVRPRVYDGTASQYITYFLMVDSPVLHADNQLTDTESYIQVDLFSKTDPTNKVFEVKSLMKAAGFIYADHRELYEDDTKLFHDTFTFKITQKAPL